MSRGKIPALEQENAQLTESLSRANAECDRLREALAVTSMVLHVQSAASLPELLETLSKQIFAMPGVDGFVVNLMKDAGDALATVYLKLPEVFAGIQSSYKGFQYRVNQPDVNVQVFNGGNFVIVTAEDLGQYAETTRMRFVRWKMQSLVVVPVNVAMEGGVNEKIGTIMVFSQNQFLDEQMAQQVQKIGDFFARQIQIHWNYYQSVERGKLVEAMYGEIQQFLSYISEMNSLTSVEQVYELIGREFISRFRFDMVSILLEEDGQLPIVHTAFSEPFEHLAKRWEPFRRNTKYSLEIRDGQSGFVFLHNQRFLINDLEKVRHLPMSEKDAKLIQLLESTRTFLYVPIRLSGKVIGVLWLATLAEPLNPPETDLTLIELLSSFISTSIRNAKLHEDVEQKNVQIETLNEELQGKIVLLDQVARIDRLTGLNNFGNFEEELKRRTSEFARKGSAGALSVILIDVDRFKIFNDTFGHPAGNVVLQEVAARVELCVRDMDFVARFGGEEFVVLLPQCDFRGAEMIAERIRSKIADTPFIIDGVGHRITISGGYALFTPSESASEFIFRVDEALYAAKRNGRNRIEKAAESSSKAAAN